MSTSQNSIIKPAEIAFASYVALGYGPSEAYRRAYKAKTVAAQTIAVRAQRLMTRDVIIDRVAACVSELKLEQLDSLGRAYSELISAMKETRDAKEWPAYANLMRQRLQCLGMLKDNINITAEHRLTDEQIIERIAAKDPTLAPKLRLVVGSGDAYST